VNRSQRSEALARAVLDRAVAAAGLIFLSPVFAAIAAAIALQDGLPVFFRQERVGRFGQPFRLLKFRSMRDAASGVRVTAGGDPRITRIGRILRKYKLDELPQLWNVLKGEMSLVGPRPEVPCFVDLEKPAWRRVLSVKPGLTDLATLIHRDEEVLLRCQADPEEYYRDVLLPAKMNLSLNYIESSDIGTDIKLIFCTIYFSICPRRFEAGRIRRIFHQPV
jgi:lipopolysaccharide/colanic/teichoic acid biosynthesis glycosyltransferase